MQALEVVLDWDGPFTDLNSLPSYPGVYVLAGGMYGSPDFIRPIYIGMTTVTIRDRWKTHEKSVDSWFTRTVEHLNGRLHCAEAAVDLLDDIESALIYVHQPHENSKKLATMNLTEHDRYVIRSEGNLPRGILAEIDTCHPWFGLNR